MRYQAPTLGLAASCLFSPVFSAAVLEAPAPDAIAYSKCETYPEGASLGDLPPCSKARVIEDTVCKLSDSNPKSLKKHARCMCDSDFFSLKKACHRCVNDHGGISNQQLAFFDGVLSKAHGEFCRQDGPSDVFAKVWLKIVDSTTMAAEDASPNTRMHPPIPLAILHIAQGSRQSDNEGTLQKRSTTATAAPTSSTVVPNNVSSFPTPLAGVVKLPKPGKNAGTELPTATVQPPSSVGNSSGNTSIAATFGHSSAASRLKNNISLSQQPQSEQQEPQSFPEPAQNTAQHGSDAATALQLEDKISIGFLRNGTHRKPYILFPVSEPGHDSAYSGSSQKDDKKGCITGRRTREDMTSRHTRENMIERMNNRRKNRTKATRGDRNDDNKGCQHCKKGSQDSQASRLHISDAVLGGVFLAIMAAAL